VRTITKQIRNTFGRIDILVNSAGGDIRAQGQASHRRKPSIMMPSSSPWRTSMPFSTNDDLHSDLPEVAPEMMGGGRSRQHWKHGSPVSRRPLSTPPPKRPFTVYALPQPSASALQRSGKCYHRRYRDTALVCDRPQTRV
jgi:hypothetical protein